MLVVLLVFQTQKNPLLNVTIFLVGIDSKFLLGAGAQRHEYIKNKAKHIYSQCAEE